MTEITKELLENAAKELGNDIARAIREKGGPGMGFAFFVFDYGPSGSMGYASSANRAGVLAALKDFIRRQEAAGEPSLHVDQRAAVARVLNDRKGYHVDGLDAETREDLLGAIVRAATSTTSPAPPVNFEEFLRVAANAYTPAADPDEREAQRAGRTARGSSPFEELYCTLREIADDWHREAVRRSTGKETGIVDKDMLDPDAAFKKTVQVALTQIQGWDY